jgi:eukaryotic-like serine/threonine-protein kinase
MAEDAERPLASAPAGQVKVGDTLAQKYRVERVLGRGGMGVVVAARHKQLGEHVAIKFLLPESLASPDVVARFLQEGRAAVRIRSEHVARVLDVGTLPDGAPYLVMEYLDGLDLRKIVRRRGPLPIEEAVDLVLQACEAIAEAHSLGIIHRDLKPANLILTQRADGSSCVKVIDFGISKVQKRSAEETTSGHGDMTESHVMMGSPLYMAPEQMLSSKDADARSDVWSLASILHTLVTGQPPFRGDTVMQIYDRIIEGLPPLANARADAPPALDAVLRRALLRNPAGRFGDVGELASALKPFASARGKLSVEGICRLSEQSGARRPSPLTAPDTAMEGSSSAEAVAARISASSPLVSASAERENTPRPEPGATSGPWERERAQAGMPRRRAVAVGLAILAVGAGLVIGRFVLPPAPPTQVGPEPGVTSPVGPAAFAPIATPAADAAAALASAAPVPEVTAEPSASAPSAPVARVASPPSSVRAGRPAAPPSRSGAPTRAKPPTDLFAEPL